MNPTVSIVVPVFGDGPELDRCVEALLAQTYPPDRFDVVIVDNGSNPAIVPRWGDRVTVLLEEQPGSYAARNRGVGSAEADVLAFTDADCEPEADWLRNGVAALAQGETPHLVTGRMELTVSERPTVAELYESRYAFAQERYLAHGFGVTANLFVPRPVFDRVGTFDGALLSGGDREFGKRAAAGGIETRLASDAVVRHPARTTVRSLLRKSRRTTGGLVMLERREAGPGHVLRKAVWLLRPPVRAAWRLLRSREVGSLDVRMRLVGIICLIRVVVAAERVRLTIGGTHRRA